MGEEGDGEIKECERREDGRGGERGGKGGG